jgi:hypothetical protein
MAEEAEQSLNAAVDDAVTESEINVRSEQEQQKFESDFAIKMVETLVAINDQQISIYELPNRFFTTDELNCFGFFSNSVPVNPLPAVYPENGFLLFRGVPVLLLDGTVLLLHSTGYRCWWWDCLSNPSGGGGDGGFWYV